MPLPRQNWSQRNHDVLNDFVDGMKPGEIAVFDWDNTCIFGDIGEALLRRLTFDLAFAIDVNAMAATIPDTINGIDRVLIKGKPFSLKKIKEAVLAAYERLKHAPPANGSKAVDENVRVFTSGLLALNRALEETPGIGCEFAYPWVNLLLQGLPLADFDRLAAAVIERELHAPLRRHAVSDPRGRWRYAWTAGVRLFPEMNDLATAWQERGGAVVVSTASNRLLVEKMVAVTGFPCRRVIGMGLATDGVRFGRTLEPGLAANLGAGKVANIRACLENEPVLVAGDSSNDYEMLSAFPSTRMRLIVNRQSGGRIDLLYRRALAGENGYLAQEIDPTRGKFKADYNPA